MIRRHVLLPEAIGDANEAYKWYELRSVGLGERFLSSIEEWFARICREPELFEFVYKTHRRAIVRDFPYVVFYKLQENTVIISSIFHSAQNPRTWRRRLKRFDL